MSYVVLLREILEKHQNEDLWFLILEDDIKIKDGFYDLIINLIEDFKGINTDYVRLYSDPQVAENQFSENMKIKNNIYYVCFN